MADAPAALLKLYGQLTALLPDLIAFRDLLDDSLKEQQALPGGVSSSLLLERLKECGTAIQLLQMAPASTMLEAEQQLQLLLGARPFIEHSVATYRTHKVCMRCLQRWQHNRLCCLLHVAPGRHTHWRAILATLSCFDNLVIRIKRLR